MDRAAAKELRFQRLTWVALVFTVGVVLWGAYVRATGSGAGCGNHWPLCNGEVIPRSPGFETLVEFTHRASSGLAFLFVLGLGIWATRVYRKGHPVRWTAMMAFLFMVSEALVGAGLVLFGLVKDDDSMARAWVMAFHLSNTFLLLGFIALTAWWGRQRKLLAPRQHPARWIISGVLLAGLLLVGISGAVAALGDTLFPSLSLSEALAHDFSAEAHFLIRLRVYHPAIALVMAVVVVIGTVRLMGRETRTPVSYLGVLTILLFFLQLTVGLLNVVLLAPVWLQLTHLALADFLWISAVLLAGTALTVLSSHEQPEQEPTMAGSTP